VSPDEARRAALRKFGNVTRVIDDTRDVWRVRWLDRLAHDVRHACRALAHSPAVSLIVVLMLATGIGFSTTAFGLISAVLLRPPAYPSSERVVWIANYDERFKRDTLVSQPTFGLWQTHTSSFDRLTAFAHEDLAVEAAGTATQESA
jgi:putative ABC transport system permease protein